ncbi:hypothetical protein HGM15179_001730, partial [Zosterops borbonicus]
VFFHRYFLAAALPAEPWRLRRYRRAPSTGASGKVSPPSLCRPGSRLPMGFDGSDQLATLLSCRGELRHLARGITLLPSSPTRLSRHLRPSP